ncbi:MAG: hypothetical protein H6674_07520 [Dehalococcoidia bacterium]|nr:hypothetical protein [Dehalococcoidia bacterium]MCB9491900.1 hypothetical protein [Dehalococcoidia bacterium]
MVTNSGIAERWAGLASAADDERVGKMREVLDDVLALGDAERTSTIESMVQSEYALDEAQLRPFTISRLRAWLQVADGNMDGATSLARGYDAAFDKLGASLAMRRSTMVQTVARHDLTPEEVAGLFNLIPSIVRQVPKSTAPTRVYDKPEQKKPFWKFW